MLSQSIVGKGVAMKDAAREWEKCRGFLLSRDARPDGNGSRPDHNGSAHHNWSITRDYRIFVNGYVTVRKGLDRFGCLLS